MSDVVFEALLGVAVVVVGMFALSSAYIVYELVRAEYNRVRGNGAAGQGRRVVE